MSILFLLIPLGLILLGAAIWAFFWAVGSGQFDDMDTPAWSVIMDDDSKPDAAAHGSAANPGPADAGKPPPRRDE